MEGETPVTTRRRQVVIVGGGTAGWMSAALLAKITQGKLGDITLVESEEIGTIGVGEATIPAIKRFNRLLEIHERDFVRQTQASFKLGIEFVNWGRLGTRYFHPFGQIGDPIGRTAFHQFLTRRRLAGETESFEDYSLNAAAAKLNHFATPPRDDSLLSTLSYAYHFDASLYAAFLRRHAEGNGVRRVEGRIRHISQNAETGFVETLTLESGQTISGDFFIDCSGLSALLIEKTLKSGFDDWSAVLPCNSAAFVPSEKTGDVTPYTRSTAHTAGWQWRIPLQHRTGNGYVFCDAFASDEEATEKLLSRLEGKVLAEPRVLKFTAGHSTRMWEKNVVSLGLASGFLEPLESTSIYLVQSALARLMALFPRGPVNSDVRRKFNDDMNAEYECVRDFLIAHYKLTERDDTPFWRMCRDMDIPERLKMRLDVFKEEGLLLEFPQDLFKDSSWFSVLMGQGLHPKRYHPLADAMPREEFLNRMTQLRRMIGQRASALPTHSQYISQLGGE